MATWYWSADNLFWQVSIYHMNVQYHKSTRQTKALIVNLFIFGETGRHVARLRRRRRPCAYAHYNNTASHYNYEKISSWVSFSFLHMFEYGAPLGGPSAPLQKSLELVTEEFTTTFHSPVRNAHIRLLLPWSDEGVTVLIAHVWPLKRGSSTIFTVNTTTDCLRDSKLWEARFCRGRGS